MTSATDGGREPNIEPNELQDLVAAARALRAAWGRSGMGVHVQARAVCDAVDAYDAVLARELGVPAGAGSTAVSFTAFELAALDTLLPPLMAALKAAPAVIAVLEAAKARCIAGLPAKGRG